MKNEEVIAGFLESCPSLWAGWDERVRSEDVCGDAPTDLEYVGIHLKACYMRGDVTEFPAAFAFLERFITEWCWVGGADPPRTDCISVLFPLWLLLEKQPQDAIAFANTWLGPYGQVVWTLCGPFAEKIREGLRPFLAALEPFGASVPRKS